MTYHYVAEVIGGIYAAVWVIFGGLYAIRRRDDDDEEDQDDG